MCKEDKMISFMGHEKSNEIFTRELQIKNLNTNLILNIQGGKRTCRCEGLQL